jgi:hypothetical protein
LAAFETFRPVDSLSAERIPMQLHDSAVRILYGIIYDAPGTWIDGQGQLHQGGGGPGDPVWAKLSPAVRDDLIGRAILEIAALTANREVHAQIVKAASALVKETSACKAGCSGS